MRSANQVPMSGMACSAQTRSCAYMAMRIGMPADAFASLVCYSGDAMTILVITVDCLSYRHCHIMINSIIDKGAASVPAMQRPAADCQYAIELLEQLQYCSIACVSLEMSSFVWFMGRVLQG